jgi:peptide-methionine (S)-S-oxide reductase
VPENPIRTGRVEPIVLDIAQAILDAGADVNAVCGVAMNSTALILTATGLVVRRDKLQDQLLRLFVMNGAKFEGAAHAALGHGETDAARTLVDLGHPIDLVTAAGLGIGTRLVELLPGASDDDMAMAVAAAVINGRKETLAALLDAGAPCDRFNPNGFHPHSTPLHQAALAGNMEVVELLLSAGASTDVRDRTYQATPEQWAEHGHHPKVTAKIASFSTGRSI